MAELYIVEFKGSRRDFFYNTYYHTLSVGEHVITQVDQGEEIGVLAKKIEKEITFSDAARPRSILRSAGKDDLARLAHLRENEKQYKKDVVALIQKHGLVMKVVDVECQFDGSKITFFFTADHRVDFRALVRDLAARYRTRIELRQIGVRDEARRLDGYGICGLRQCCNGPIREFAPISTQQAREQELSLNPSKISGNCGRLLCCLRYEVDLYREVKQKFPPVGMVIRTEAGHGPINRIDVFREEAVFVNEEDAACRAKPSDILEVIRDERGGKRKTPQQEPAMSREEQEELKRLESGSGNAQ
jgi:cell fate regulator YaaT (PSP1 superfamily)